MTRRRNWPPAGIGRLLRLGLLAAAIVCSPGAHVRAAEGSSDARFLEGLRGRGLFRLSETYCLRRLANEALPEGRRAELAIELSRSLVERAVHCLPDEREPLWRRAAQATDDFIRGYPVSPRLPLVQFQGALVLLARGELARQEAQVVADNQPLYQEARSHLREAIRRLAELTEDVRRRLHAAEPPSRFHLVPGRDDRLADHELGSLQKHVEYQLSRAFRNQGECYPPDSPDRAHWLTQAVHSLDPLANLQTAHALAWKSRLEQIACYRLLGDGLAAARRLDAVAAENPPPKVALQARAERLRLALAAGRLEEAIALLASPRELDGVTAAELDYARLETCLQAWRAARQANDRDAALWQTKATETVRLVERLHGPYWTRRAEMLLASYVQSSPATADLDLRVRAAESLYRSGRLGDALEAYDQARELAQQNGDASRAFQLGYVAATIEHQRHRHQEALRRYRQLALSMPNSPKAAEAHLLAIYHAEQLLRTKSTASPDQYVELLYEHLDNWSETASLDQIHWRLARLRQRLGDWEAATAAYRAISAHFPDYEQVVEAAGRCYQGWLDQRRRAGQPTDQLAAEAAGWFESLIPSPDGRPTDRWSPVARTAALSAARLWSYYTPAGFARAERTLSAALQRAGDAPPEWTSAARAMLVFALAGQGRQEEAANVLSQVSADKPEELLRLLEGFDRVAARAPAEARHGWAELQLQAIELLEPQDAQLGQSELQILRRLKAQALADVGRVDEALDSYRWLSKVYPRDAQIQEAYARLLSDRTDAESLAAALYQWRQLESSSRPGSPRWFRAKYEVASLHYRLGNTEQTEKIIKLVQVLHPEMGGAAMKSRFLELLDRSTAR